MKSMCCLCIQFTHENTSERIILHQVNKKNSGGGGGGGQTPPEPSPFQVWLLALQKRLATPLEFIVTFIVFSFTRLAFKPMIYHTSGNHSKA
jgi:hypothetical protein